MVKTRQKSFRAFVFVEGEVEETIAYIDKNLGFLERFLLIFAYSLKGEYEPLHSYLIAKGLKFVESSKGMRLDLESKTSNVISLKKGAERIVATRQKEMEKQMPANTLVLHRTIRSGEEIITKGDVTIFGRINSGAHIQSGGNVQIFGEIGGNVFCDGEYMILGQVGEGNVLFQGEILDKALLKHLRNKVYRQQDSIVIEEL